MGLATVRFVRVEDWLLVLNDEYLVGGYNFKSDTLAGEYDWKDLPFTVRREKGVVVAEAKVGQRERGGPPLSFPIVKENGQDRPTPSPSAGAPGT